MTNINKESIVGLHLRRRRAAAKVRRITGPQVAVLRTQARHAVYFSYRPMQVLQICINLQLKVVLNKTILFTYLKNSKLGAEFCKKNKTISTQRKIKIVVGFKPFPLRLAKNVRTKTFSKDLE